MSVVLRQTTHQNQASCGFWFENGQKTKVIWSKKNFIESMAKIQDPHTRARGDQTAVAHARGGGKSNLSEQGDASEHIYSTHGEDMASAKNFGSFSTKNTI